MDTKDENLELLDLALGELSPEAEAELRARVAGSPELQAELAALEEGLALTARIPIEPPPRSMDDAILAAARRQVARAPAPEPRSAGARFVSFLRDAINGPQAAMATITVLVVAVGLWFIPTAHRESEEQAGMRISDATLPPPEDGDTVLQPAAEAPEPAQTATGGMIKIELEEAKRLEEASRLTAKPRARRAPKADSPLDERAEQPPAPVAMKRSTTSKAPVSANESAELHEPTKVELESVPHRSTTRSASSGYGGAAPSALAPEPAAQAEADEFAAGARMADTSESAERTISRLPEAERLVRARSYGAALALAREIIASPRATERVSLASAYDVAARSERALGRCAAAVPLYRKILADYPSYPRREAVAAELADCLAR
jgi:hypothetical protein